MMIAPWRWLVVVVLLPGGCAVQGVPDDVPRPAYCTRSLAGVDCWETENPFGYYQRGVADGRWALTPEQERDRTSFLWCW
jgi:hypothetical protein